MPLSEVIKYNGRLVRFSGYQQLNNLSGQKVSRNFGLDTDPKLKAENGDFLIAQPLIELLQAFREFVGVPVKINSGYRTQWQQNKLIAHGSGAAKVSPHVQGMAADIDTTTFKQSDKYASALRQVANKLGIKIRIGLMQYKRLGSTFVHVDVCPMYYAPGMPYHNRQHPVQWETEMLW